MILGIAVRRDRPTVSGMRRSTLAAAPLFVATLACCITQSYLTLAYARF